MHDIEPSWHLYCTSWMDHMYKPSSTFMWFFIVKIKSVQCSLPLMFICLDFNFFYINFPGKKTRIGIGRVQLRLSQKCVGLWQSFLEPFYFTERRTWLMVWFCTFSFSHVVQERVSLHWCMVLGLPWTFNLGDFWRGFKFLFIRYEVHFYYSFVLMVLLIEIQVQRLCKCVFKSTQMWRMVLVMKAFLLDGKNQRDRPDAFFCPLPELISQKTTPVSIVFYYALNLASCFFWYGAATGNFFFFFFLGKARNRFF